MSNLSVIECHDIKKCPCCGFSADMWEYQSPQGPSFKDSWYKISCTRCGMKTCRLSSKRQALRTWNRRKGMKTLE